MQVFVQHLLILRLTDPPQGALAVFLHILNLAPCWRIAEWIIINVPVLTDTFVNLAILTDVIIDNVNDFRLVNLKHLYCLFWQHETSKNEVEHLVWKAFQFPEQFYYILVQELLNELSYHYREHGIVDDFVSVLAVILLAECFELVRYMHSNVPQEILVNVDHFAAVFSLNALWKLYVYFLHLLGIQIWEGHLV